MKRWKPPKRWNVRMNILQGTLQKIEVSNRKSPEANEVLLKHRAGCHDRKIEDLEMVGIWEHCQTFCFFKHLELCINSKAMLSSRFLGLIWTDTEYWHASIRSRILPETSARCRLKNYIVGASFVSESATTKLTWESLVNKTIDTKLKCFDFFYQILRHKPRHIPYYDDLPWQKRKHQTPTNTQNPFKKKTLDPTPPPKKKKMQTKKNNFKSHQKKNDISGTSRVSRSKTGIGNFGAGPPRDAPWTSRRTKPRNGKWQT